MMSSDLEHNAHVPVKRTRLRVWHVSGSTHVLISPKAPVAAGAFLQYNISLSHSR